MAQLRAEGREGPGNRFAVGWSRWGGAIQRRSCWRPGTPPARSIPGGGGGGGGRWRRWRRCGARTGGAIPEQLNAAAKKPAAEAFNAPDGPGGLCQKAVAGRYPFVAGSANDIPLDDFGKLFAPGGLIDTFFNTQLVPFVNTAGGNWKLQPAGEVAPPIGPGDLAQFQRAAAIRDLFFGPGGKDPAVRFDITPLSADNVTKQVTIDLGDQQIVYAHGPVRAVTVNWPGANRIISARLAFDPPPSSGAPVIQTSGPWALFRLFDRGTLRQTGSADRYNLDFILGDRQASFEIRAGSVLNPLAPGLLREFAMPGPVEKFMRGFAGKIPARGDFVHAGLPRDFTDPWHDWQSLVIAGSRTLMGEAWLDAFLEAPVWRFILPPGLCGARAAVGLIMPSVDKVGRYFPLTLAALPDAGTPNADDWSGWLDAVEDAGAPRAG